MRNISILQTSLFCFALLLVLSPLAFSQSVQSSCAAPDSIVKKYRNDADQLALRRIFRQNLHYKDSTVIPKSISDTVLNAILAVYNLDSSKERDTVFDMYNIRTRELAAMRFLNFDAETNLNWVQSFENGIRPVRHPTIDSLLTDYRFKLRRTYPHPYSSRSSINLELTDTNLNVLPIAERIRRLEELDWICVTYNRGDGDNIWDSVHTDHVELLFSIGRDDCPSGCIYRKHWRFKVYFDCSVEFVESFEGPNLRWVQKQWFDYQVPCFRNYTGVIERENNSEVQLFPNPASAFVELKTSKTGEYTIYSLIGREVQRVELKEKTTKIDIEQLMKGTYLLHFQGENTSKTVRFLKQ